MASSVEGKEVDEGLRRLGWLSLLGAPAMTAGVVYALTGRGVPCPVLMTTGFLCPLCGGSRMGAALLAGDLADAWRANPFALVLVVLFGAVWAWTAVHVVLGRPAELPGPLGWYDRVAPGAQLLVFLIPAVVFGVVRNVS